ncbi:hypothetical protein J2Z35_001185 [Acetoanaerobium pronyense]|uniref:Uncharacterized protein n=1 Tax=Acetoanaerobium pronyense TaxID=1482736 RepID=A0ABS4KJV3_9FIRM|nr:hypothetical protein [Acetoanaerobium pronyense]MBP2027391.1 hypothetical protein [Acetoanaerobium pronyense]
MPSLLKTAFLQLNKWAGNEYPKREDFVSDNEKIDAFADDISSQMAQIELDFNLHKIQTVTHVASFTRDVSIAGLQVINIPFKAKSIASIGAIAGTKAFSEGFWAENNASRALYIAPDGNQYSDSALVVISPSSGNFATVYINSVTENEIILDWQKSGTPAGTATVHLLIQSH